MSPILALVLLCAVTGLPKTDGSPGTERQFSKKSDGVYTIKSEGGANKKYSNLMGVYKRSDETLNEFPVYKQMYGKGELHMDKQGVWSIVDTEDGIMRMYSAAIPTQNPPHNLWNYADGAWVSDPTLTISQKIDSTCIDIVSFCPVWAKNGNCRDNTLIRYCPKSCGICWDDFPDYLLDQQSCATISTIPPHIAERYKLDPDFYGKYTQVTKEGPTTAYTGKYTEAYGFPITSSKDVDDRALMRMCYTVRFLYASHKSIRKAAHEKGARFIIIGQNERTTEMPPYSSMDPGHYDGRRGLGLLVASASEEVLLDYANQLWAGLDSGLHEVAHNFHLTGTKFGMPELYDEINKAYESANKSGKYVLNGENMYARKNFMEYFAQGTNSYMGDSTSANPPHNAEQLKEYDLTLYDIMKRAFKCNGPEAFIYLQTDIDQVLSRQSRIKINAPDCEEEPSSNIPPEEDIELKTQEEGAIYTWGRQRCRLQINGHTFENCPLHEGNPWCPTHTEDGKFDANWEEIHRGTWGWCYNNEETTPNPCEGTKRNKACIFPFYYLGLKHVTCQGTGWCATEVDHDNNMTQWSTCDTECYSRDENEKPDWTVDNMSKG